MYEDLITGEIKSRETVKAEYEYDYSNMTEKTYQSFDNWIYDKYFPINGTKYTPSRAVYPSRQV